jgi:hypothetical protein
MTLSDVFVDVDIYHCGRGVYIGGFKHRERTPRLHPVSPSCRHRDCHGLSGLSRDGIARLHARFLSETRLGTHAHPSCILSRSRIAAQKLPSRLPIGILSKLQIHDENSNVRPEIAREAPSYLAMR